MAENSSISWTRHTWNPVIGCTKVSPACDGCYAEAMMDKRYGRVQWGAPGQGNGTRVKTSASTWAAPFKWQRQAGKNGDRPFVFCASLADVFDNQWEPQWRAEAFEVMRKTPNLVYLLLTKRPQNIIRMCAKAGGLPSNAAIGTTVEDTLRLINLYHLALAAEVVSPAFTFASFEPLLEIINPAVIAVMRGHFFFNAWTGVISTPSLDHQHRFPPLGWAITGGETDQGGHRARPTHPEAFRVIRDQAAVFGAPYHHKQNGEWVSVSEVAGDGPHHTFLDGATVRRIGKQRTGRTIDGVTHDAFPEVAPL